MNPVMVKFPSKGSELIMKVKVVTSAIIILYNFHCLTGYVKKVK